MRIFRVDDDEPLLGKPFETGSVREVAHHFDAGAVGLEAQQGITSTRRAQESL
ncbi:hypothetical protein [Persicimonas caeni]|uniref:hypothetical protein n=1 Tax=Persicimonas caeni TaxID=2292766 RepID=UPI00143D12D1|nr:hypothetical protein [Persicimonas caeni]